MGNIMESNNKYYVNNYENGNYYLYRKLILDFQNKILKDDFKFAVFDYMKKYCDVNFNNDIMMVIEDFNSVISQAIQAIKSLLSENERLIEEQDLRKRNNQLHNLKQENNPNFIINNNSNSKNNCEKIPNNNNLKLTQDTNNTNINNNINTITNNNINIKKNENNNNVITNNNINDNKSENNNNINNNENINNNDLNLNDIPLDNDIKNNSENEDDYEPLRKPLRQLFKNNKKKKKKIYLPIQNFPKIIQNEKKPLRIMLNSQLSSQINNTFPEDNQPLTTKSDEIPYFIKDNINKSYSNITNNNNNIMIFNSNLSAIENINTSNELTQIPKEIEIEKLKITNEILKLIEIANDNKIFFVEKYINKSSLNLDNDYKEFLTHIINYQYDMEVLNDIFKDIKMLKRSRNNNFNKPLYMKDKNTLERNSDYLTFSESNEIFKKNLRNYNFDSSINKIDYIYKTNPYNN